METILRWREGEGILSRMSQSVKEHEMREEQMVVMMKGRRKRFIESTLG